MSEIDLSPLVLDRSRPTARRRSRWLTRYALPASLLLGFAALAGWSAREVIFPPRAVTVVPVLAAEVAAQQVGAKLFQAAGWVEPRPTAIHAAALAPGLVEKLLVVEDQEVAVDQPVAELIKRDAELAKQRADAEAELRDAELAEAQATLAAAEIHLNQPVHLEAILADAEAELARAETALQSLPFETRRAQARLQLAEQEHAAKTASGAAVSELTLKRTASELAEAQATVEELNLKATLLDYERKAAKNRRDAFRKHLDLLADEIRDRDQAAAKVRAAAARLEQARVAADEAQLQLDRMTVRAPVAGRVFQLVALPGTRLTSGMSPNASAEGGTVVTLYQPAMLQVRADVRFENLPKVHVNQPVLIGNPALEKPLSGRVLFISSRADIQKNTLEVKVAMDQPSPLFKPEMLVDVTFLAVETPGATATQGTQRLLIPASLVRQDETGESFVWLADQSAGVARRQVVTLGGAAADGLIEVTAGLNVASRLIAGDASGLRDGLRIRVSGEEPEPVAESASDSSGHAAHRAMNRRPDSPQE